MMYIFDFEYFFVSCHEVQDMWILEHKGIHNNNFHSLNMLASGRYVTLYVTWKECQVTLILQLCSVNTFVFLFTLKIDIILVLQEHFICTRL